MAATPSALDGQNILVAEDEIVIAMEVQSALEDAGGHVVGPAHTLGEALELAAAEEISAAVLDLRLGNKSADRIAKVLTDRGVPFLFYSGQTALDPERAKWPDIATVSKPASNRALVKAVVALLEQDPSH
jgi:DNA-binding response OmpR family regulator